MAGIEPPVEGDEERRSGRVQHFGTRVDPAQVEIDRFLAEDGLAGIAADKAARIEQLTRLGEQHSRHLAAQNLTADAAGMASWLKLNPGFAASVSNVWRDLLALAESARQINQHNGVLIETRLQQNRLKLAVLLGAAGGDGVYRPDGQLRPPRSARSYCQV